MIRVSPNKDQEKNSPPKIQNLLKEPSQELCRFTDHEIDQIHSHFPPGTIFRPFDSTVKSDCSLLSGCAFLLPLFNQAMPMLWRVLYTLEHIISKEDISLGLTEVNHLYNLVSHGSHVICSKPSLNTHTLSSRSPRMNPTGETTASLSSLTDTPATPERVVAFWDPDSSIRTYQPRIKDSEEASSTSNTM
ncbi:hypothetical protein Hanom_Chr10g00887061 [Helianthus anomalus]